MGKLLLGSGSSFESLVSAGITTVVLAVVAVILAIAATVLAMIFIVPEKRREKLNAFGKFLHDTCNFKFLLVEKILQVFYIFTTSFVIINGFFTLFQNFLVGLLTMIFGPIIIRLIYELIMVFVLLLKNVIMINKKMKDQTGNTDGHDMFAAPDLKGVQEEIRQRREASAQNRQTAAPEAGAQRFCMYCGTPLDENGQCPNCKK